MFSRLWSVLLVLAFACTSSSPADPDEQAWSTAARACARLSSCFEFEGIQGGFNTCLGFVSSGAQGLAGLGGLAGLAGPANPHSEAFACAAAATDCDAAGRCINGGMPASPCEAETSCDGTVLRTCWWDVSVATDCARSGLDCVVSSSGVAQCGVAAVCSERTSECRDGEPVICFDDVEAAHSCDADCLVVGTEALCADTSGPPCEPGVASARCDGETTVNCPYGFETRVECATGSCRLTSDGALCESIPECRASTCTGDTLNGCANGRIYTVDCQSVGARTCDATELGARCVL